MSVTKYAMVFPGQGSQSVGMMDGFAEHAATRTTFAEASDAISTDLWSLVTSGPAEELNQTINTQPAMLAAGVAVWRIWQEAGLPQPEVVAGHSLGEYTALVAAGAIGFADAVRLVRLRAGLMQSAVPEGIGAMAAILGMDDEDVVMVCRDAAEGLVLEAVNFNAIGQVVIAGNRLAVERGMLLAKERGAKRAVLLPVSVPSHCSLMQPAAEELAAALASVDIRPPVIRVLHNCDVLSYDAADDIRQALANQLYRPVRWVETVRTMADLGIAHAAECGPGKVLAGLARRIDDRIVTSALVDLASLDGFRVHLHQNVTA